MKRKVQKIYETTCPSNAKFFTACLSSPEGDLYAASDENKSIYIWKRGKEYPLITLTGNSSLVTSLHLNASDAELYSGLRGGLCVIWDLESSKVKYNLQGHSSEITSMSMAKCEGIPTYLVTSSLDGKIKWWDIRAKGSLLNLKGHLSAVRTLSISPDFTLVASGAEDGLVRLWDIRTNKLMKEFSITDQGTVNCVEFNPYSITLAYGANDKTVKHWDLQTYSLISVTPFDRTPIVKLKFDSSGKNVFSCTNESLKYWMIDDEEPKLLNIFEAGWNKLQDVQYVDEEALYGLNIYGNKIGYWMIQYDKLINPNSNTNSSSKETNQNYSQNKQYTKRSNSEVVSDLNNNNQMINKYINNIQNSSRLNTPLQGGNSSFMSDFNTESFFNNNQCENVFMKNGLNIIQGDTQSSQSPMLNKKEIIVQKTSVVINNINSNVNLSGIANNVNESMNTINETFQFDLDPLANLDINRRNSDNILTHLTTNTSFASHKTSEPIGLDFNKFLQANPDETIHEISQSNDLPLLQAINDQHSAIKGAITKRYNSLKMISKWWSDSNISSALTALNMMKDLPVINDFFNFCLIQREDIKKIPLSLDNAISLLPHVLSLINSKYEAYCKTGCKAGMILLRIFNERISLVKSNFYGAESKEDRFKKCEVIIEQFDKIFRNSNLDKLRKRTKNQETSQLASGLYTDLEFFLKPYKK